MSNWCAGYNRFGEPCGNRGDFPDGYCEYHYPICGALTKRGTPCRIRDGECKYHNHPICGEIAKSTGRPCRNPAGKCPHHGKGRTSMSERTETSIFRLDNLRDDKWGAVVEHREGKDAYSGVEVKGLKSAYRDGRRKRVELDHVLELQVVRDNFDLVPKTGTAFQGKKDNLADFLRSDVVNAVENLNITSSLINDEKYKAITDFQGAFLDMSRENPDNGLVGCLLEHVSSKNFANEDKVILSRDQTRRIQEEIVKSYYAIDDKLEHEQPLQEEFSLLLSRNFAAMKLK